MSLTEYLAWLNSKPAVKVTIPCSCRAVLPLEDLFFCRSEGCNALACNQCTTPVIDTYFCPTCLNSVFSTKAFEAKNKCRQCALCPVCAQTLGIMARETGEHYLKCEYCKWSSDEVGLTASNAGALFDALMSHEEQSPVNVEFDRLFTALGVKVAPKKPKKDDDEAYQPPQFQDPVAASARVELALNNKKKALHSLPKDPVVNPNAVRAQDADNSTCTIPQRLAHPEVSAQAAEKYWPARVDLSTKMGCKCHRCDKFLIKPKAGAIRTNFDIHFIALAQLPRVTVGEFPPLKKGAPVKLMLYFKNPLERLVEVKFLQWDCKQQDGATVVPLQSPSEVTLPSATITLAAYDEAAEQAEGKASALDATDDPKIVGYRSLCKVGVYFSVTPRGDHTQFSMLVSVNVMAGKAASDPPIAPFTYQLIVDLGSCAP